MVSYLMWGLIKPDAMAAVDQACARGLKGAMVASNQMRGFIAHHIGAVLADGRQDHRGDPLLERPGFGLLAAQDEGVQAGLVDDGDAGVAANSTMIRRGIQVERLAVLIGYVLGKGGGGLAIPEGIAHVLRHEPRKAVDEDCAEGQAGAMASRIRMMVCRLVL